MISIMFLAHIQKLSSSIIQLCESMVPFPYTSTSENFPMSSPYSFIDPRLALQPQFQFQY